MNLTFLATDLTQTAKPYLIAETTLAAEFVCSDGTDTNSIVNRVVSQVSAAILMFGLGCSTEIGKMWSYVKQVKQFGLAMFLQLIVMPFLGFGLSQAFQMTEGEVIGVIIQASCPGGIYSNIVSYYLDGNIHLSIVMTTVSTVCALGTIPLWLFVFPEILQIQNSCLRVPFEALGYTLLGILVPLCFGLLVEYKFPKQSEKITKICTLVGSLSSLIYAIVVASTQNNGFLNALSWRIIVVGCLQFILAFIMGYIATRVPWFAFNLTARRTVAIETVFQNGTIATTIVLISFDTSYVFYGSIFLYPLVYTALQLALGAGAVGFYLLSKRFDKCKYFHVPQDEEEENEEISIPNKITPSGYDNNAFNSNDFSSNL